MADEAIQRIIIDLIPESEFLFEYMPEYDGPRQKVILDLGLVQKAFWEIIQWNSSKSLLNSTPEEITNMTRGELKRNLPNGWEFQEHNGRIHIKDENRNFRVRIDSPDKVTNYTHIHLFDENENPLDILGNIVSRKDPAGHIPYND